MAAFVILTICTGNVWRSPLMAAALQTELGSGVTVQSAGTAAAVGAPLGARFDELLRRGGGEPLPHRAAQLTTDLISRSQLIVAAATEHRAAAVELVPAALRRSFTLGELAAAARLLPAPGGAESGGVLDGLRLLMAETPRLRPRLVGTFADLDDPQADPGRVADRVYREILTQARAIGDYCRSSA